MVANQALPVARLKFTTEKKEAQIEIQAVAKIQYPIKSHIIKAKSGPTAIQRKKVGFVRLLWNFVDFFPQASRRFFKCRLLREACH